MVAANIQNEQCGKTMTLVTAWDTDGNIEGHHGTLYFYTRASVPYPLW